ncbi:hypothetical protein ACIBEK_23745 [Nocardia fusca]|uniref:hypothetical protein n=1 Tax=Nocardia fusca TaxID=941183 RepID=UPI003795DE7F
MNSTSPELRMPRRGPIVQYLAEAAASDEVTTTLSPGVRFDYEVPVGQNNFQMGSSQPIGGEAFEKAIQSWMSEAPRYDYNNPAGRLHAIAGHPMSAARELGRQAGGEPSTHCPRIG